MSGLASPFDPWSLVSNVQFAIQQAILRMQTVTLVKVISCTNSGGLSPIGTVDIQPLVNQIDATGTAWEHTTIHNVPYQRMQSGQSGNAVIMDPQPGDIGIALFASRDISKVITTNAAANPGSQRRFDYSDALYIGGMLNSGTPTQYIRFAPTGIEIVSPTLVTIQAPTIKLEGNVMQSAGIMTAQTDILAGPNNISLIGHTHTSEAAGSPTSPPIP